MSSILDRGKQFVGRHKLNNWPVVTSIPCKCNQIIRKVSVIPVVIGAIGAVSTRSEKFIKDIRITLETEHAQKTALLGTARILRFVLNC